MEKKLLLQNLSIPEFEYKLPAQRDGFNCGVFVSSIVYASNCSRTN